MSSVSKQAELVAILFHTDQAVKKADLQASLELDNAKLIELIAKTSQDLATFGLTVNETEKTIQLVTSPEVSQTVSKFFGTPKAQLSQANLEVLAVIAYNQPVSLADIDDIRGVASEQTLKNLINKDLVAKQETKVSKVTKTTYVTTQQFLNTIGISSLTKLPTQNVQDPNK